MATGAAPRVLFAAAADTRKRVRRTDPRTWDRRLRYEDFERLAREDWERIPDHFKTGVDGLVLERKARAHPSLPDIYTLGECLTESYPSDFGGPDTIRSFVVLYYGSFDRLSRLDQDFDWEGEIWETLTHELQHHLESLAADEALVDMDYAVDEGFKRREGEPFDPSYYRAGEDLGDGWYRVEDELYCERDVRDGDRIEFDLDDRTYRITLPPDRGDVSFLEVVDGLPDDAPPVHVVAVRRRRLLERITAAWKGEARRIVEAEVEAETVRWHDGAS